MKDTRQPLPAGTKIGFDSGSIYEISGDPIGFGGGSIIYPAVRYTRHDGEKSTDGFDYVLKECFPAPGAHRFVRAATGEIIPEMVTQAVRIICACASPCSSAKRR